MGRPHERCTYLDVQLLVSVFGFPNVDSFGALELELDDGLVGQPAAVNVVFIVAGDEAES